ncbi:hypothetical protein HNY73_011522 [Argiope bruennichi]|uniref:RNase H type-1 domain-containing protein n=1 Tax=Argiope bruennichi TaxID=94029 RepID=A0A8T0F4B6_ARGBR|nr:hypothetical protein HNY73_011522 [Argiope bruennichi]
MAMEKEILAIKIKNNITFKEARQIVKDRMPKSGVSYSSLLKSKPENTNVGSTQTEELLTKIVCPPLKKLQPLKANVTQTKKLPTKTDYYASKLATPVDTSSSCTSPVAAVALHTDPEVCNLSEMDMEPSTQLDDVTAGKVKKKSQPPIAPFFTFRVGNDLCESDRFPIFLTQVNIPVMVPQRPKRYIFDTADWTSFTSRAKISRDMVEHPDLDVVVDNMTSSILRAADETIPKSGTAFPKFRKPWWNNGSKSDTNTGCAFVCENDIISYKLHDFTSVFISELTALYISLKYLSEKSPVKAIIYSDSLSALESLNGGRILIVLHVKSSVCNPICIGEALQFYFHGYQRMSA